MKDFTLLVDMDDTIEYLSIAWNDWLNCKYGLNVGWHDWTQWDVTKTFPTLTEEQVFEPLFDESFWKTVIPIPESIYYLKKINDELKIPIYICTASHPYTVKYKYDIIKRYFRFINPSNIIITSNKKLLNAWYLIDDGIHNFGGNYKGILYTTPWNKNLDVPNNVTRVTNWKEIYKKIKKEYYEEQNQT